MSTAKTNYIEVKNTATKEFDINCPVCNWENHYKYVSNNRRSFGSIHNSIRYECKFCKQKYIINFYETDDRDVVYSIVKLC